MSKKKELDYDVLFRLYITQCMTQKQMCNILNVGNALLVRELKRYGLSGYKKEQKSTHKMSKTRFYRIWQGMKNRCNNPNDTKYHRYGGRGISHDASWEIFDNFYKDMHNGYSDDLTLERVNSEENYSKGNCKWATYKEQNNNKSDNLNLILDGEKITVKELSMRLNISPSTIYKRISDGWELNKIISTPALSNNGNTKGRKVYVNEISISC